MLTPPHLPPALPLLFLLLTPATEPPVAAEDYRITDGLQVLYQFQGDGDTVADTAGAGTPINLKIADNDAVHRETGQITLQRQTILRTEKPPRRLILAIRKTNALTLEAWVTPANVEQAGPARLVTLSKDSVNRNVTLGQDGDRIDVRLRTNKTSDNGLPSLSAPEKTLRQKLVHVVYTRADNGRATLFLDGELVATKDIKGKIENWNDEYQLAIGDELSGGRPWLGTLHLVAIYSRALTPVEVLRNFKAGDHGRPSAEVIAQRRQRLAAQHFETSVAPILARNCLECHDASSHAGNLNLATKEAAMKGGDSGAVIVPGNPEESDLWISVESDAMPHDRAPLNTEQKTALKKWIADGAAWTLNEIDPAVYVHGSTGELYVQRLTVSEYIETVKHSLGVDIEKEARELLPPDLRADGFSNTAYNLNVDLKHVGAYSRLAEIIVSRMDVDQFVRRFSKRRKFTDKDMEDVILNTGQWVLRGPVNKQELFAYRGITTTVASAGGSFPEAMGYVIEAMLQSPRFMYRVEEQRGNGGRIDPSAFELASRLSYMIWGGPPDKNLLDAAAKGELPGNLQDQVKRMLQNPRARQHSQRFVADWLNLNRLKNLQPNRKRFPDWSPELAADMQAETVAYFDHVVWDLNKPMTALLNAQVTFTTNRLARFYGIDAAVAGRRHSSTSHFLLSSLHNEDLDLRRIDLAKTPGRGGLLTQGSVLTVGGDDASMVTRGLLVMHELLRGVVNDPPPCVDTTPVPTKPGKTQRSIAMERIADNRCGGCHSRFEPLAFGLEKFDGIGRYHQQDEHGNKLRDDGEILVPGTAESVKYDNTGQLMDLLANSERVGQSFTWKITQFALGRPLVAEDAATIDVIHKNALANGGTWTATMSAIVTSDLVTQTRTKTAK